MKCNINRSFSTDLCCFCMYIFSTHVKAVILCCLKFKLCRLLVKLQNFKTFMAHYARTMQTALNAPHPTEIFLTSEPTAVSTVTIEAISILQKSNIIVHFNLFPLVSEKEINKPGLYHSNNLNNAGPQWSLEQALKQFPEHDLLILFLSPVGNKQVKEDVGQVKEVRFIKELVALLVAGNVAAKTELNIEVVGRNEQPVTREGTTSDCVFLNYHLTNKIQQLFQLFAIFMEGLNTRSSSPGSSPVSKEVVAAGSLSHNMTQKSNTYDSNAFEHGSSVLSAAGGSMTAGNMETLSTKGEGIVDHSEDKQRQPSNQPSNETVATAGSLSHHNHSTTHQTNTYDSNASEHGSSVLLAAPKCTTTENTQSPSTKTWTKDITTNKVVPANNKVKKKKQTAHPFW